jgi:hypothetical protein
MLTVFAQVKILQIRQFKTTLFLIALIKLTSARIMEEI